MTIHPATKVSGHSIIVELRRTDNTSTGFIGVRKSWDYDNREMKPAEVIFNIAFNYGSRLTGHTPDYATEVAELIKGAAILCEYLDFWIKEIGDFKKDISVQATESGTFIVDVKEQG